MNTHTVLQTHSLGSVSQRLDVLTARDRAEQECDNCDNSQDESDPQQELQRLHQSTGDEEEDSNDYNNDQQEIQDDSSLYVFSETFSGLIAYPQYGATW